MFRVRQKLLGRIAVIVVQICDLDAMDVLLAWKTPLPVFRKVLFCITPRMCRHQLSPPYTDGCVDNILNTMFTKLHDLAAGDMEHLLRVRSALQESCYSHLCDSAITLLAYFLRHASPRWIANSLPPNLLYKLIVHGHVTRRVLRSSRRQQSHGTAPPICTGPCDKDCQDPPHNALWQEVFMSALTLHTLESLATSNKAYTRIGDFLYHTIPFSASVRRARV